LRIIVANAVMVEAGSFDFKCVALSRSSSRDARRVAEEKRKTVVRHPIKKLDQ